MIYQVFGVIVNSDLPLKCLPGSPGASVDVRVESDEINSKGLYKPNVIRPLGQIAKNELWFYVPGIAKFHVCNGKKIRYQPMPDANTDDISLFIMGTCMAAILHQRGRLVLHANTIKVGHGAIAFAGASGRGKSTLAAALNLRGYQLLSDDMTTVDEKGSVYPSYPHIKIWQDTADYLGINTCNLERIRYQLKKYSFPLGDGFYPSRLPLKGVCVLATRNEPGIKLTEVFGFDKFFALTNNTYRHQQLNPMGLESQHMRLCTTLAKSIPVYRLARPNTEFCVDKIIDTIESQVFEGLETA